MAVFSFVWGYLKPLLNMIGYASDADTLFSWGINVLAGAPPILPWVVFALCIVALVYLVIPKETRFVPPWPIKQNETSSVQGASETKVAAENPTVSFTFNHTENYFGSVTNEINIHYKKENLPVSARTFVKIQAYDLKDAGNISAVTNTGAGEYTFNFIEPLNSETLAVHSLTGNAQRFNVIHRSSHVVSIVFEDGEPDEVSLRFDD